MSPRNSHRHPSSLAPAFSLIELLCVMAILVILYSLYFSAGSKPYQRRQQEACGKNLQFIHQALQSYALDHQDRFPWITNATSSEAPLSLLVPSATTRTEIFLCPGTDLSPLPAAQPFDRKRISYAYLMGLDKTAPSDQWIAADALVNLKPKAPGDLAFAPEAKQRPGNNHKGYGGMVLFADGRAERSPSKAAFALTIPSNCIPLNPRP